MIVLFVLCFAFTDLESLYVRGDYETVIEQAPLVLLDTTLANAEIVEINKFYAYSLAIMGKKEAAMKVFYQLLDLKPDFMPDPVTVSPKITNIFNEAKNKKLLTMPIIRPLKDTIYIERKIPFTMLIPGVSQIQRDKKVKGFTILATEILSLTGLAISQYNYSKYHDEYLAAEDPQVINDKYEICNAWYKKRTIFISTSIIIWLYNLVDVLYFQ
ncbi:hypothetical protein AMJ52_03615 [candidate division TA06 bacterium DG_78]|uniref:Uncharacterized protein n=1 Tax=candidate division TA06 bacterium DG_78 TaxID=1703772 RepID=A0A0S7YFD7_UNCT6|nr:MAG: hypothetical protein AMJ52_03615 [candidate division TA06 bacterium DG_78]